MQHTTNAWVRGRARDLNSYFGLENRRQVFSHRYEHSDQQTDFTGDLTRRLLALRKVGISIPRVLCPQCGNKMRLAALEPHPGPNSRKETTTFTCECGEGFSYTIAPRL